MSSKSIRQFVRFAAKTVENAASIAPTNNPADVAHRAAAEAARIYAPGLMIGGPRMRRHGGRWVPARRDPLVGA